jgi:copper(I)-binding protein
MTTILPAPAAPCLVALCLAALGLATPALAEIEVHDPRAALSFPGAPTASAYMVIHNHGGAPDRLLSASSPLAGLVEIHDHVEEDGVMRMVPQDALPLPTDGEIVLEAGGLNVMLMGLEPLSDGDVIPVTLLFEEAGEVVVEVPVGPEGGHGGSHDDHGAGHDH